MATEYLWLEERVNILDGMHQNRSEWGAYPGKCFIHRNGIESDMKEFIKEIHNSIIPTEEKTMSKLEELICCCGNRQNHKSVSGRYFGYTAGVNLPEDAHEERQMHLIEQIHNMYNTISSETEATSNVEADLYVKILNFLENTVEPHRYRVYNPGVVRLLHILKQNIDKPVIDYMELPVLDFVQLIEGPFWEECAQKLRTQFCTNIFLDCNSAVIESKQIGIYLQGPSLCQLKSVKSNLTTYVEKTKNPPKEKAETVKDEQSVEGCDSEKEKTKAEEDEGKVSEDTKEVENVEKTTEQSLPQSQDETKVDETKESKSEPYVNDKKRDSRSVDRSVEAETSNKELFTRSKSMPATSSIEVQEQQSRKAKRAKYDSECSDDITPQPSIMRDLTLFKETLSLVLHNKLGDIDSPLVNL